MLEIQAKFFKVKPSEKMAVTSQVALKRLQEHLRNLEQGQCQADRELMRTVHEEVYVKLQAKHDIWKKNYRPVMSLNAVLCLLS